MKVNEIDVFEVFVKYDEEYMLVEVVEVVKGIKYEKLIYNLDNGN